MIFSLEALRARHGDSLILHYGNKEAPHNLLIDGGPGSVYADALKPRLDELRSGLQQGGHLGQDEPLKLDLIMVSHIDDDHIGGLLRLTDDLLDDRKQGRPPWLRTKTLWHNSFGDLAEDTGALVQVPGDVPEGAEGAAVLASVPQGRRLQANAELLDWPPNAPFGGLVRAPGTDGQRVKLDDETELLVLAPRDPEVDGLRKEWIEQMRKIRAKEAKAAKVAAYLDGSAYNLSSIVVLATQGQQRMLLTGDARGDHILEALEAANVVEAEGSLHVDVLKLPHHGSIRNVEKGFFDRITADHYVISANGKNGNPESETLELIAGSRAKDDAFTIHLTYAAGEGDLGQRVKDFEQHTAE
jgi:glyoxylase-like metal-dependent hydrolase (beta-lactamase superfamily II)